MLEEINKEDISYILNTLENLAEPSFKEYKTTEFIINFLGKNNIPIDKKFKTGCFGTINVNSKKTIALRADIDALPIDEKREKFAHLCGHHGHTTALLQALKKIIENREKLKVNIRYIFQPAEETGEGALFMIKNGAIENVNEIYSLHGDPNTKLGDVGITSGELMAGASLFTLIFEGKSTHAAFPHKGSDVIAAFTDYVNLCQKVISRFKDPLEEALISFCKINCGTAANILPSKLIAEGTIRFFNTDMKKFILEHMDNASKSIENFYNVKINQQFSFGTIPLINDNLLVKKLKDILSSSELNIVEDYTKMMGSEDFSYFLEKVPGVYLKVGIATSDNHPALHNIDFFVPVEAVINYIKIFLLIAFEQWK